MIKNTFFTNGHSRSVRGSRGLCYAAFIALCLTVADIYAADAVLKDVKISTKENDTVIDVHLGMPLSYVKHFPQSFGEIIQVQLKLDKQVKRELHKEVRQGSDITLPAGVKPLLIYVTYEEGVPGGPYLTLRFKKPIRFRVADQADPSLLSIVIAAEEKVVEESAEKIDTKKKVQKGKPATAKKDSDLGQLMAKARQALTFGDNEGAIRLLRKIISVSGNPYEQDARELLGLALERSSQIPRAKFEYKKYLELYKEGEGPKRVQQRLQALQNIGTEQRQKLRVAKRSRRVEDFKFFGRLSQDYNIRLLQRERTDREKEDGEGDFETLVPSQRFTTHLSTRARYRTNERNLQAVFIGSHVYGLEINDRTEGRISDAYVDYEEIDIGVTTVLGRQRARNSGVFDRFDGIDLGYRATPGFKTHILVGRPVFYYDVPYNKEFGALRFELGRRKSLVSGNAYVISQNVNDTPDRQAVGGDFRVTSARQTLFGAVDYDFLFQEPSLGNLRYGLQYIPKARLNISYDYRKLLLTSAAIGRYSYEEYTDAGNVVDSTRLLTLESMQRIFSDEEILELAQATTPATHSVTLGNSYQFNKNQQLNIDYTLFMSDALQSVIFDDQVNDRVNEEYPPQDPNNNTRMQDVVLNSRKTTSMTLTTQLISNNTFAPRDLHVLGLRVSEFTSYRDFTMFWNARLPAMNKWNPRPRLNIGFRSFDAAGSSIRQGQRYQITPSIKIDRRFRKAWVFEVELGFDVFEYVNSDLTSQRHGLFRMGYHYTF